MKMLRFRLVIPTLLLIVVSWSFTSCVNDDDEDSIGNWIRRSYFEGSNRANAAAFSLGSRAFIMGGYTGDEYLKDFWEYSAEGDHWIKKADFPGKERSHAVAFAINGKGYVGTGYDGTNRLKDFWEYDPEMDSWKELSFFGGTARYSAVGFSLMGKGYIGTGYDGSDQKDFWEYDPETDTWEQIISMGGAKRSGAVAFVIDNVAYVTTGINNGQYEYDLWALDGETMTWSKKRNLDYNDDYLIVRSDASAFTVSGYGYVCVGQRGSILGSVWEYRPSSDIWEEKTNFEGTYRTGASALNIQERAYILLGRNSGLRFDDIWEFRPFEIYNEDD